MIIGEQYKKDTYGVGSVPKISLFLVPRIEAIMSTVRYRVCVVGQLCLFVVLIRSIVTTSNAGILSW